MGEQTVSFDKLVDFEYPINLRRVDKKPFLFYLAGKVPLSVTDLASKCSRNEAEVRKILDRRFQSEVQTDHTGFLKLTDAARSPVVSYGKQFISQAKNESNRAAELREDEQIEAAGARYYHAAELLAGVRKRLAAVNYVPDQLDASVEQFQGKADSLYREHAKDVYKHRNLLSNQREEEGDEAFQKEKYGTAETKYRKAHDALQEALKEVSNYNDNRLFAESPRLRTDSLKDRLETLQSKYAHASESHTAESTDETQSDSAKENDAADETPATDSDSDAPSEQALIDAVEHLAHQLGKAPTATEMKEQGRFEPHQYYDAFGKWKKALEQTELNVRSDLISDLRRVADDLDKRPTQSEMDEHGRYAGQWYTQYFETWKDSLEAADIEEPTEEELITEIQRLDKKYDKIPMDSIMRDEGQYTPELYYDRFGGWDEALQAAGITPNAASERSSDKREPATSKDLFQGTIQPDKLAELYESLRVLNKILIEYIKGEPGLHLRADEPIVNWQSAIEDVAVGDGISADVPCLGQLHADRNPFSMSEYREQYGDGDRVKNFQAIAVAEIGAKKYSKLAEAADSTPPKPRLPIVPGNGKPLPITPSSGTKLSQALELLEKLLTTTLDVDTFEPPAITALETDSDSEPTKTPTSTKPSGTDSYTNLLTMTDIDPNETYDGSLVGQLTGYIINSSGEATPQLHFKDMAGDDFWLYITDQNIDYEWENGNWYFISQFQGPEELGGGRGDQALQSTSQLSVEDHGTSLPPSINADVSESESSRTLSLSPSQTTSTTASSDGQTATTNGSGQTATSSRSSSSDEDHSGSEPNEETDPMVDDLLGDMEDEDLL